MEKGRKKVVRESKRAKHYSYKTSAKPPKKAPARARMPKLCPNSNAAALPALESAASASESSEPLLELSSAELLSLVEDAPPKPE